jgi:hypothetical protein
VKWFFINVAGWFPQQRGKRFYELAHEDHDQAKQLAGLFGGLQNITNGELCALCRCSPWKWKERVRREKVVILRRHARVGNRSGQSDDGLGIS